MLQSERLFAQAVPLKVMEIAQTDRPLVGRPQARSQVGSTSHMSAHDRRSAASADAARMAPYTAPPEDDLVDLVTGNIGQPADQVDVERVDPAML